MAEEKDLEDRGMKLKQRQESRKVPAGPVLRRIKT